MNKDIKKILIEIICFSLILIVSTIVFLIQDLKCVEAREIIANNKNGIDIEIVQKSNTKQTYPMSDKNAINSVDSEVIKITNIDKTEANYDFILKMSNVKDINAYKILFQGNIYSLKDIKYTKDNESYYFTLDTLKLIKGD